MLLYIPRKYKRLAKLTMLQIMTNKKFLDGLSALNEVNDRHKYILDECTYMASLYAKAGHKRPLAHKKIPILVDFKKLRKVLSYYIEKELQHLL